MYAARAASTLTHSSGSHTGSPGPIWRVTATWMPSSGAYVVTGQSLPKEMVAPSRAMVPVWYCRAVRSGPSRGAVNSVCHESNFDQ